LDVYSLNVLCTVLPLYLFRFSVISWTSWGKFNFLVFALPSIQQKVNHVCMKWWQRSNRNLSKGGKTSSLRQMKAIQSKIGMSTKVQGVSFEILQFQMARAQKWWIFDLMLVKPKCVWEAVVFYECQLIFNTCKSLMPKMTEFFNKHHGLMDKTVDCHA